MNRFITTVLAVTLVATSGCSSLGKCFRGERTQVSVLDQDLRPITNVEIKGKFGDEYVMVPRSTFDSDVPTTTRPAASTKKASATTSRQPTQSTATTEDDVMVVSWDRNHRIQVRGPQGFDAARVVPELGGDWDEVKVKMTIDRCLDPEIVGPLIDEARRLNKKLLAKHPDTPTNELFQVRFNVCDPIGEKDPRYVTSDNWGKITEGAIRSGRIVLEDVNVGGEKNANNQFVGLIFVVIPT